jgi:hypothetical protein
MGKSSRSNRKKALGTERRRHLQGGYWLDEAEKRRAEVLAKCLAADPVPVENEVPTPAAGDVMETDDRGRQGAPEPQQKQQSKKKKKSRGDALMVEAAATKRRPKGVLKGINKRVGYINLHQIHEKKRKGKKDISAQWFVGQD